MRKNPLDLISSSDKVTIDKFKHDIYEIKAYRKIYIDLDVYSVKAWLSGLLKASDINRYVEEKMGKSRNRMCKECFLIINLSYSFVTLRSISIISLSLY